ncbi:MAG: hypothetical protein AAB834_05005 [Patescibacteria group bacterium]
MQRDKQLRPEGNAEVQRTDVEQTRLNMVRRLALVETTQSLERQLGLDVVDSDELAQRGLMQATTVLHNTLAQTPAAPDNVRTLPVRANIALDTEVTPPLPDFAAPQQAMPTIEPPRYEPPVAA